MSGNWDFYFCTVDDKVASIFVDLDLIQRAPVAGLDAMVYLRLYLRFPREDGLSSQQEYEALAGLEDEVTQRAVMAGALYVGRNTTDGFRDFVFYCADSDKCVATLRETMRAYSDYKFDCDARPDPQWSVYREFLYPAPRARQTIENRRVYAALEQNGDALTQPREIDHWIYFADAYSRGVFVEDCRALGFALRAMREPDSGNAQFGVQIFRVDVPNANSFDGVVTQLFDLAKQTGGEYDGWETKVI